MKKLKILAAGDIHGDSRLARSLADLAEKENVDLVILSGDLTFSDKTPKGILAPFKQKNKKVILIPGNHDSLATADFLAEFYGVKNIHGYSVRYEDVGIFGCSGVNIGINALDEEEIFNLLAKSHERIKYLKKRVMVTHTPPTKTKMEKLGHLFLGNNRLTIASRGVKKAIEQLKPDILICSHLHEAEGIEEMVGKTKVINVGKKGKTIEL